jgi:hypothetical protein
MADRSLYPRRRFRRIGLVAGAFLLIVPQLGYADPADVTFDLDVSDSLYQQTVQPTANGSTGGDTDFYDAHDTVGSAGFPTQMSEVETQVTDGDAIADFNHNGSYTNGAGGLMYGGSRWDINSPTLTTGHTLDLDGTLYLTNSTSFPGINVNAEGMVLILRNGVAILGVTFTNGNQALVTNYTASGSGGATGYTIDHETIEIPFEFDLQDTEADGEVGDVIEIVIDHDYVFELVSQDGISSYCPSTSGPIGGSFGFEVRIDANEP